MKATEQCHNHVRLDKQEMGIEERNLSDEQLEKVRRFYQYSSGSGAANLMDDELGGFSLSQQQARYIANKKQDEYYGLDTQLPGGRSSANQLINVLESLSQKGELGYVALYHEVKETTLITICKHDAKRDQVRQTALHSQVRTEAADGLIAMSQAPTEPRMELSVSGSDGREESTFSLTTEAERMSLASTLLPIVDRLEVGKRVLLAAAWTRTDERRLFEMYPEVLMFDVTFQTNNEGCPLGVTCSPDGNMNIFTPIRAFLPSQCRWVFDWVFGTAMPILLGKEPLRRMQLLLSDGDRNIYEAFESKQLELYPQAKHGLCLYHLVTQTLEKMERSHLPGLTSRSV